MREGVAHLTPHASRFVIFLVLLLANACLAQPDYAREKRWADEITPSLVVGNALYLTQKSGHRFLALYTAPTSARAAPSANSAAARLARAVMWPFPVSIAGKAVSNRVKSSGARWPVSLEKT